jgi:hypothetical protein
MGVFSLRLACFVLLGFALIMSMACVSAMVRHGLPVEWFFRKEKGAIVVIPQE